MPQPCGVLSLPTLPPIMGVTLPSLPLEAGSLLIAQPHLQDPHFAQTVVMILEHDAEHAEGTLGLILNRPVPLPLGKVWENCPESLADLPNCAQGGPVQTDTGLVLHSFPGSSQSMNICEGLYVGADKGELAQTLSRYQTSRGNTERLGQHRGPRLFLGHAGWGAGQLARKIARGDWLMRPGVARFALICQPPEDCWQTCYDLGRHTEPSKN